jgi:hypothetical protein
MLVMVIPIKWIILSFSRKAYFTSFLLIFLYLILSHNITMAGVGCMLTSIQTTSGLYSPQIKKPYLPTLSITLMPILLEMQVVQ